MRGVVIIRIPKNSSLKNNSQKLRNKMTKEERHLWYDFLKLQPYIIKRQQIIDRYIVDFYCPTYKFVIEIDGSQHYFDENKENDKFRDEYLNKLGLKIFRYSNYDINYDFDSVCQDIMNYVNQLRG